MWGRFNKGVLNNKGQITVFLSLLFLVLSITLLCLIDGIRIYLGKGLAQEALITAGKDVTANFQPVMARRYHLFCLDPKEEGYIVSDGKNSMEDFLGNLAFTCENLQLLSTEAILDEKGSALRQQMISYVKYKKVRDLKNDILGLAGYCKQIAQKQEETLSKVESVEEEQRKEELDEPQSEQSDSQEVNYAEPQVASNWKEIKDLLESIMESGILLYISGNRSISTLSISQETLPSQEGNQLSHNINSRAGEDLQFSFQNLGEIKEKLQSGEENLEGLKNLSEDFLLFSYIHENFRSWQQEQWKQPNALLYEQEYLIAGKNNDHDNLKYVANGIFRMRFLANYAYACTNPELSTQAELMALSLCGLLGFPEFAEAVKYILLAALSYGESLLDLHSLYAGRKIPLIKDASCWMTNFENIVLLLKEKTLVKEGVKNLAYQDYLDIFIGKEMIGQKLVLRMADLMQSNISLEDSDFMLKDCLSSYTWRAEFCCNLWNPGWISGQVPLSIERRVSYE